MFLKSIISPRIGRWLRSRAIRLWVRFPMVCVLAIALIAISMQECLEKLWSIGVFLAFLLSALSTLAVWRVHPKALSISSAICVTLGIAWFISAYHAQSQQATKSRFAQWEQSVRAIKEADGIESNTWKPLACRCVIDSSLRYRKSSLPGGNSKPGEDGWQTLTVIQIQQIRSQGKWQSTHLLAPVSIDGKVTGYYPGDVLELYGQWRLPGQPSNPGQFDSSRRYAELGYAAQARADSESQIQRIEKMPMFRFDRYLAMVSALALDSIDRYVILGQSELTAALVLGQREQAEWKLQEELLATGTIHMLSISGMHIEMVALSLLLLGTLYRVPRRPLLLAVCCIVIAYALLCGANPPVARATMMLSGACVARWMGWTFSSLNFLAFAGFILILYRTTVVFETGTQLSFMAVAVLILSTNHSNPSLPPLEKLIDSKSGRTYRALKALWNWSREMIRTSFWVWFITAPLVWSSFHVISPIAIALNLWLWPPMLFALVAGLGMIALGWFPLLGWPLGIVCGASLWIVQWSVNIGEQIPWGHFWLRSPPSWWLIGFYILGILIAAISGVRRDSSRRRMVWVLGGWFAFGLSLHPAIDFWKSMNRQDQAKLCLTFIDVGHGTCMMMETPDHETWLYDAGRLGDHQRSYQVMVEALWALKKPRVDRLILSHADSDHYNGVDGISKRFAIGRLISTPQVFSHTSPLLRQTLQSTRSRGVPELVWKKGDSHQGRGWSMLALHPPEQGVQGTDNASSLCVMIEFAGKRVLLPGDLEPPGMQMLVSQTQAQVDILMAPHHGSLNSKSDALLAWCNPGIVVISGSHRAVSPRVIESYHSENRQVLVTARDHAIRIEISKDGTIQTKHWVNDAWSALAR